MRQEKAGKGIPKMAGTGSNMEKIAATLHNICHKHSSNRRESLRHEKREVHIHPLPHPLKYYHFFPKWKTACFSLHTMRLKWSLISKLFLDTYMKDHESQLFLRFVTVA